MRFEAVIFDLFGTLVDNFSTQGHKKVLSNMATILGISNESFIKSWFETFNLRCLGEFNTPKDNIIYVCNNFNVFPNSDQLDKASNIRFNYTKNSLIPKKGAIETLKSIKHTGHKIALISDCSSEVPAIWGETPFSELFDVNIFSCEVGIKKPNIEIYQLACDQLFVSPKQCLYVGDGSSNELSGANLTGMLPLLFQDPKESDAHRIDEESWKGDKINQITEVLNYL